MSFINPIGLLSLLAIPVLIIIYIIKNKYTEKVVSSNYIWKMSEKFIKKRNPLREINGLIAFILQLLSIIVIALAIAHPVFKVKNGAAYYEFVLDGSASMNIENNGKTRFETAKGKIIEIVDNAVEGSLFSLIYAGESTSKIASEFKDVNKFKAELNKLNPTTLSYTLENAISLAQNDFDDNPATNIYIVTDKDFNSISNATLINVSNNEENYSITSLEYELKDNKFNYIASVSSYDKATNKNICLYVDDNLIETKNVNLEANSNTEITFNTSLESFKKVECKFEESDSLKLDDSYTIYYEDSQFESKVLLISDSPFYLYSALRVLSNVELSIISTNEYEAQYGYDIYIFDCFAPETLPTDGSIWFIGVSSNVVGSNFTVQEEITLASAGYLTYESSNDQVYKKITKDTLKNSIAIGAYYKYSFMNNFTSILSYEDYPLLMVGSMANAYKEVIFSFDLHCSDLVLQFDYAILIKNLVAYSHLSAIDSTLYSCGDLLTVEKIPNASNMKLTSPKDKVTYFDFKNSSSLSYVVNEVGHYTLSIIYETETIDYDITVLFPFDEASPTIEAKEDCLIVGNKKNDNLEGKFDSLFVLILAIILLAILDWGWYLYEQHQLY